jgi:hypothetical protein
MISNIVYKQLALNDEYHLQNEERTADVHHTKDTECEKESMLIFL